MFSFEISEGAPTKNAEKLLQQEMHKSIEHFERELSKVRTGRAHVSMIEDVKVFAYGGMMPLAELASLSVPEPSLITVQPWDKSLIADIEKALLSSDFGVTPLNDGSIIRLPLPKLSAELREDLVKIISRKSEEAKISIRAVRKEAQDAIRGAEKNKKISEDYGKRLSSMLQKVTDDACLHVDALAAKKSSEVKTL